MNDVYMKTYKIKQPLLRISESVKEDTLAYRGQVEKFLQGQTSPVAFRAYRVPMGIYEQRAAGSYMVRIRIGAGLVLPYQLERIAQLSKAYGNGIVHVTTRQDIQIHEINIEDTPDVLEGLLEVGLSSRGGGGNTVRNVTACPRAGACPKQQFDVAPYAIATAEYLLQFKSSYNLPRKYKIVFSGCSDDCAFASVADLGFFAHKKNGTKGFSVYAGGGLGSNPAVAVKIEDFVHDNEFLEVAEAIKRLFDKHGDRANKHKARLRYVLKRVGERQFVKLYEKERSELRDRPLEGEIPDVEEIASRLEVFKSATQAGHNQLSFAPNVLVEKAKGLFTISLRLNLGHISGDDLIKVGQIAEKYGCGLVRTTHLQDLLITSVPGKDVESTLEALKNLSIDVLGNGCPKIVACTGAATCKLGLCLSRNLADAISKEFHKKDISVENHGLAVRISGCPNSCSNHYIAHLGFEGKAKRVKGRLMPFYDVLAGVNISEGVTNLALKFGAVPAKRIPQLAVELLTSGSIDKERTAELVAQYADISSDLPEDYYSDFGTSEPFSLAGRGPGECGAGVMDVVKVDIDEAKEAIKAAAKTHQTSEQSNSLYEALVVAARALLAIFGVEPKKDREIFAAFRQYLIEPGWVRPQAQQLFDYAIDWRMGDRAAIDDLLPHVQDLVSRVEELFLSLDANLKFKAETFTQKTNIDKTDTKNNIIDLRGVACPLNFVKAKLELEKIPVGEVLELLLDDGEPVRNAPASFAEQGQEIIEIKNKDDHFSVKVRRRK
ncbi:MAG: sulfurtransferase TusA family protein [Planctomycetota bacterium]|jgi:sulfite reductase (ferredoxin)